VGIYYPECINETELSQYVNNIRGLNVGSTKRAKYLGFALMTSVFIIFGAPCNPLTIYNQVERHLDPTSLLNPNSLSISQFNNEFESFLTSYQTNSKSSQQYNPQIIEISSLETFVRSRIKYRSDFFQYLVFDHLATDSEIIQVKIDDCDGRAILASSLLIYRGYDAWVIAAPGHYWVEINLNNDQMHILEEESSGTWYFKFNGTNTVYNWSMVLILIGSYIFVIYLALIFSIGLYQSLSANTTYRTLIIFVLSMYFGFIVGYILLVG